MGGYHTLAQIDPQLAISKVLGKASREYREGLDTSPLPDDLLDTLALVPQLLNGSAWALIQVS